MLKMDSMKRLVVTFLMALVLMPLTAMASPSVFLTISDDAITVGETFDAEVWVDGDEIDQQLLSFCFDVATTGSSITYDSYAVSTDFSDDSASAGTIMGLVDLDVNITADDVLLATLSFTATETGTSDLTISATYDGDFYGLFYETDGFDISASTSIEVGAAVPVPGAVWLLGSGLVGLIGFRRKTS